MFQQFNKATAICASNSRNYISGDKYTDIIHRIVQPIGSTSYISKKGCEFEDNVVKHINERIGHNNVCVISESSRWNGDNVSSVIEAINRRTPVIVSASLKNQKYNVFGVADIIMLGSVFKYLFPNVETECPEDMYVCIDVKFKKVKLCSNGIDIQNSLKNEKFQLSIYYNCLMEMVPDSVHNEAYILGRSYEYTKGKETFTTYSPFSSLGRVVIDTNEFEDNIIGINDWNNQLENNLSDMYNDILEGNLYTNIKSQSFFPEIIKARKDIAINLKHINLLPYVSARHCEIAYNNNVKSIMDYNCSISTLGIKEGKIGDIVSNNIYINQNNLDMYPKKKNWNLDMLKSHENRPKLFVDIETISDLHDTSVDRSSDYFTNFIGMIGITYYNGVDTVFKCFIPDAFDLDQEYEILTQFDNFVKSFEVKPVIVYYHADQNILNSRMKKHEYYGNCFGDNAEYDFFDLKYVFEENRIALRDSYSYSIKEVSKSLKSMGHISMSYDDVEITNGFDASIELLEYFVNGCKDKSFINNVIIYNERDCVIMKEIYDYLLETSP